MENLLRNFKLLYVEDDLEHRKELEIFLKRRVGKLFLAKNGEEGFEVYKKENPDIIITDLKMPKIDGIELTKKIREHDSETQIIITSAFSDSEVILKMVASGITGYIVKPIDTENLLGELGKATNNILKNKDTEVTFVGKIPIKDRKEQLEYEKSIQLKFAHFLKEYTGKGPKSIKVFLNSQRVEVTIHEGNTKYEDSLLSSEENKNLVFFLREKFYNDKKEILQDIIQNILNQKVYFDSTVIKSEYNTITFKF